MNRGERIAARHYRLRGYRILGANVRVAGNELDLIVRRGRRLVFVEVKERARDGFGGPLAAVDREKRRRVRRAAEAWLGAHPGSAAPDVRFEVAAITGGRLERAEFARNEGAAGAVTVGTRKKPGGTIPERTRSSTRPGVATLPFPGASASDEAGETSG